MIEGRVIEGRVIEADSAGRYGVRLAVVGVMIVLAGGCSSRPAPGADRLRAVEAEFGISPSSAETACLRERRNTIGAKPAASVAGLLLDMCLKREHIAQAFGRTYAKAQPPGRQLCVGTAIARTASFEAITASSGADPDAQLAFAASLDAALKQCGVVPTTIPTNSAPAG